MFVEFGNVKGEMGEMSSSMQFLSKTVDDANVLMNEIKQELAAIKKENAELRVKNDLLTKTVADLQERMRHVEQYSRKDNLELSGIPTSPKENVKDIIKDLGTALGVEVETRSIAAAHRIQPFNKERLPSIVVQFQDRATKEALLAKFRDARKMSEHLTADKINNTFAPNRVYVNEHLSPENKQFFARLKQKCKEVGYVFVWCREGKFFVRKSAGEKVQRVSTMADIDHLK